jgi:hypothetical protein
MESGTKTVFTSKTMWGLLVVIAGFVADSAPMIHELLGVEWGGKAVFIAGVILAAFGRVSASKALTILPCLLALLLVGGCGSAGQTARTDLLSPWAQQAWPEVEALARRGIEDMVADGELTDQTAAFPAETVRLFGEAVHQLGAE